MKQLGSKQLIAKNRLDWKNRATEDLYGAILSLKDLGETKRFFRDLLTEDEIAEFGKRFRAAKMLNEKFSYREIQIETGLSSRTIARISRWLKRGMGGYQLMLKRIKK